MDIHGYNSRMADPPKVTRPLLDVLEALLQAFQTDTGIDDWTIIEGVKRTGPTVDARDSPRQTVLSLARGQSRCYR